MQQSCFAQQALARVLSRMLMVLLALWATTSTGCIGLVANLINAADGHLVPAACEALAGRRVAVVCVSDAGSFGPSTVTSQLAREITGRLRQNVEEIELIEQREIADWMDHHDWNQIDYEQIGQGVSADVLVAVELSSFSLHEGQTLYKGRAEVGITVYDMTDGGQIVYESSPPQIEFPAASGHHAAEISESEFRRKFIDVLASRVARQFYAYEKIEDFAQDSSLIAR